MKLLKEFLTSEEGQTSTEYILLVAAVAMIVIKFKGTLASKLEGITNSAFSKAEQEVTNGL